MNSIWWTLFGHIIASSIKTGSILEVLHVIVCLHSYVLLIKRILDQMETRSKKQMAYNMEGNRVSPHIEGGIVRL